MDKVIAVILGVFLLATPTHAKAGIFGSSFEGCVDPGDDMAGYILEKAGRTDLTRANVEHALELVPTGIEHISYGNIFKWLKTTENAAECFTKRDYLDGLKILGKHTGEFAALTTLEGAASLVAPGLFLPGTLFKWYIDILVKTLATNGFSDQVTLYIAAMEKCQEEGMTRDFCQQEIKKGYYNFATFHSTGFLVQVDPPSNWQLLKKSEFDVSEKRSSQMLASFGSVIGSGITSGEFYDGTLTIYDSLVAKYDGTFNRIESAAYEKVITEAQKIAKIDTNTENSNNGFFSNLWKKIVNLFTKNDKSADLPAQISKPLKKDNCDFSQYQIQYKEPQPTIEAILGKITSLNIGKYSATNSDGRTIIEIRGNEKDGPLTKTELDKLNKGLAELGVFEPRIFSSLETTNGVCGKPNEPLIINKEDIEKLWPQSNIQTIQQPQAQQDIKCILSESQKEIEINLKASEWSCIVVTPEGSRYQTDPENKNVEVIYKFSDGNTFVDKPGETPYLLREKLERGMFQIMSKTPMKVSVLIELPPFTTNLMGVWSMTWRDRVFQKGSSEIEIYQKLGEKKFTGKGTQQYNGQTQTFTIQGETTEPNVVGRNVSFTGNFSSDVVTYNGTVINNGGDGSWKNTSDNSGTWSMTRRVDN